MALSLELTTIFHSRFFLNRFHVCFNLFFSSFSCNSIHHSGCSATTKKKQKKNYSPDFSLTYIVFPRPKLSYSASSIMKDILH